ERQTIAFIDKAEQLAAAFAKEYRVPAVPIVFSGDFNSDRDDFYDGPGRAMEAAGYADAASLATSITGPSTTLNGMDPKKTTGRTVDRVFVRRGTPVGRMVVAPGYPSTDHNGVGVHVTLTNAKE